MNVLKKTTGRFESKNDEAEGESHEEEEEVVDESVYELHVCDV